MPTINEPVQVSEGSLTLPTYAIKGQNRNPVFHSRYGVAHIYPYTLLDDVDSKIRDKTYRCLILENRYLTVTVIPDLGGRVYSVYDKVSQREVFYKNSIVRFAPLAIRGAFFSGGVEFSFPVAHAPTTCDKVNWDTRQNPDGSASVFIGGLEHISQLRWTITLTLFPDRCALAQDVFLYNPGTIPGRYHYWTNASLDANEGTEFIYPLHRARSYEYAGTASWPYARLDLITQDPGLPGMEGVPLWPAIRLQEPVNFRWQKNMLAQVSIFGRDVEWDYFAAWQHRVDHGYAHVAKSKDVSGMKLWSWGNAPVGVINQTALTDDGSVYAETQCGAMETQLDFAFLPPGATRSWREWWLPLRGMGGLTCASEYLGARINLSAGEADNTITVWVSICPVMNFENARIKLSLPNANLLERTTPLSPDQAWSDQVSLAGKDLADKPLQLQIWDDSGNMLLDFLHRREADLEQAVEVNNLPSPDSAETYFQKGLRFENFDNRVEARSAYSKALEIDEHHPEANLRFGLILLRSAQFDLADFHFFKATTSGQAEAALYRGQIALMFGKLSEAEAHFNAACTNPALSASAEIGLGKTCLHRNDYDLAIKHFLRAVALSKETVQPRLYLAIALRKAGNFDQALTHLHSVLALDPLNLLALYEIVEGKTQEIEAFKYKLDRLLSDDPAYFIDLSCYYIEIGLTEEALDVLHLAWEHTPTAMVAYLAVYLCHRLENQSESTAWLVKAQAASPEFGFPSRLEEVQALEYALSRSQNDAQAQHLLGNYYYAHERFDEGIDLWIEASVRLASLDVLQRNLGLAFWQQRGDLERAIRYFENALALNPSNQDLYLHLDDLYKLCALNDKREELLSKITSLADVREDVHKRSISMRVDLKHYQEALQLMETENFIPLEMDQSFHNTYVQALMLHAADHLEQGLVEEAIKDYLKMLDYPANHGIGAPTTRMQAEIYYRLGLAYEKLGQYQQAIHAWREAASEHHPHGTELYPYIQMALDKLSRYSDLGLEE